MFDTSELSLPEWSLRSTPYAICEYRILNSSIGKTTIRSVKLQNQGFDRAGINFQSCKHSCRARVGIEDAIVVKRHGGCGESGGDGSGCGGCAGGCCWTNNGLAHLFAERQEQSRGKGT